MFAKTKEKEVSSTTLNTVLMVEQTMKSIPLSVFTVADLKRALPKQVNHNTLKVILGYLEDSNKILFSSKGITWIENNNSKLEQAVSKGFEL